MKYGFATKYCLAAHHFFLCYLGLQAITNQLFRGNAACRKRQCFFHQKCLFSRFPWQSSRVTPLQKLYILRYLLCHTVLSLPRLHCLRQYIQIGSDHQLSCGQGTCVNAPQLHRCTQGALPFAVGEIPLHLHRQPCLYRHRLTAVCRGIQHPCHDSPRHTYAVGPPFLTAQNALSPRTQHRADVRHSFRHPYFQGLLLLLGFPHFSLQTRQAATL